MKNKTEDQVRRVALLYARVSSKEQAEGYSIDAQLRALREYCGQRSLEIQSEFSEAFTAKEAGRPGFNEMLSVARRISKSRPKVRACIVVEKTDRLTRNLLDFTTLDELVSEEVEVHLVKESQIWSPDSRSSDKFALGLKALMAKQYSENLSEEVRKGQREKASKGMWPSVAPMGYRNQDKAIEPHPEEAPLVVKAFKKAATGRYTLQALADLLYDDGLQSRRTGRKLSKAEVSRILTNRIYYGPFTWAGQEHAGIHQPLIDLSLYRATQQALAKKSKPQHGRHEFMFSGFMTCGGCGSAITAQMQKGRYVYYHCTGGKGPCSSIAYLKEEDLVAQFEDSLKGLQISDAMVTHVRDELLKVHSLQVQEQEASIARLQGRHAKLRGYMEQAYTDKLDGLLSGQEWTAKMKDWRQQQDEIELKLAALSRADVKTLMEGVRIMDAVRHAHTAFRRATPVQKRQILDLVLLNPTVIGKKLSYKYKRPFCWMAEGSSVAKWRSQRDLNARPPA